MLFRNILKDFFKISLKKTVSKKVKEPELTIVIPDEDDNETKRTPTTLLVHSGSSTSLASYPSFSALPITYSFQNIK